MMIMMMMIITIILMMMIITMILMMLLKMMMTMRSYDDQHASVPPYQATFKYYLSFLLPEGETAGLVS